MKIYTKAGDGGETGLGDGTRVPKDALRVAAYGDVDELNAAVGLARAEGLASEDDALLHEIQRALFALGAQLADPRARLRDKTAKVALGSDDIGLLEQAIDAREPELEPLRSFILPGGCRAGALLHLARTVCRRAERTSVALARAEGLEPGLVTYLNRLSDLLFVMARHANRRAGRADVPW